MSISLTIRSGTARNFPQKGDSGLYDEVTAWANDVTSAINASPSTSEMAPYEAVVGTAIDVTAGLATHSDIATAIAAVSANDRIYIRENAYEPSAQININKALTITGQGEGAIIEGDNIASGSIVKISASGVTLENVKIIQGSGTPDYALEIAAATERCNLNIKADGTFATNLFLNSSNVGAVCGFITYDTNSVAFLGESQMVEQLKIEDQTTPAYNLVIQSDSDGTVLTADRILTIDVNNGARTLDLSENFTIGDGFDVTITAEDAASSIVLDEQSFEVEGEGTATRLFKLVNSTDSARTLTYAADLTYTGNALTVNVEDAATAVTYDNVNFEVENTDVTQRTFKLTSAKAGNTTLTFQEDFTLSDGNNVTMVAEDAAASITWDNVNFEVESTDASQRTFKITSAKAGDTTLTLQENFTIGDGFDVTITSEDTANSIVLDEQNFEVEGEGTAQQLLKLVNANNAAATLTLEGTSCVINQDVTSDAQPTFTGVVRDSGDFTIETTTSGDIVLKSVDKNVIINKADTTNLTTQTIKFGDDTGGITGIRNNNATLQYNTGGSGWIDVDCNLVAARYTTNAGQSIANSTDVTVVFEDVDYDTHSIYNTSTGVGTIPVDGKYLMVAHVFFASAAWAASSRALVIFDRNAGNVSFGVPKMMETADTVEYYSSNVDLLDFSASDTFEVTISHNAGGARSLATNTTGNFFSIHRVGD